MLLAFSWEFHRVRTKNIKIVLFEQNFNFFEQNFNFWEFIQRMNYVFSKNLTTNKFMTVLLMDRNGEQLNIYLIHLFIQKYTWSHWSETDTLAFSNKW